MHTPTIRTANRLTLADTNPVDASTYSIAANSNRLLSEVTGTGGAATTSAFTYDAAGNTLSDGNSIFTYDARGRMSFEQDSTVKPKKAEKQQTSYFVNGLGERVAKTGKQVHPSGAIEFVYDEQGHLLGEYNANGNRIEETVWLGDLPVAILDDVAGGGRHYINPDQLGAPHSVTDATGLAVWQWIHPPFGDADPITPNNYRLDLRNPGQIADPETGLFDNGFRSYRPAEGRYNESDPLGLIAGVNTYGYVGQNALWGSDRFGLDFKQGSLTLLWQIYLRCFSAPIWVRQYGHR
jgi:RHS repeat-associated protein